MADQVLTIGRIYQGEVNSITPRGSNYPHKKDMGVTMWCHHLLLKVDGFPGEIIKVQVCEKSDTFNHCEMGDVIKFKVTSWSDPYQIYTVQFESRVFKANVPSVLGSPAKNDDNDKEVLKQSGHSEYRPKAESMMGTPFSIIFGHLCNLYQNKKVINISDILSDADQCVKHYQDNYTK